VIWKRNFPSTRSSFPNVRATFSPVTDPEFFRREDDFVVVERRHDTVSNAYHADGYEAVVELHLEYRCTLCRLDDLEETFVL